MYDLQAGADVADWMAERKVREQAAFEAAKAANPDCERCAEGWGTIAAITPRHNARHYPHCTCSSCF